MRIVFLLFLLTQLAACGNDGYVYENVYNLDSPQGCSETTFCADGYTTAGKDRNGNNRDHVYPPQKITLNKWINAPKTYDADGRDQFGLNAAGKSEDGQSIHTGNVLY